MKKGLYSAAMFVFVCSLHAETVQAVLVRMDKAAPTIQAMTAQVEMITYEAVIQDKTKENGLLQMQKQSNGELRAVISFTGADQARTIALLGKYVEIYYPKVNTYQRVDLGSQGQVANQLLLLGFGTSGTELAKAYDIAVAGEEKLHDVDTTKLQLTPKDAGLRAKVARVYLWIPITLGYPIQQQFLDPPTSGNWRTVTYSQINLQPSILGKLDLKLPKGAVKQAD